MVTGMDNLYILVRRLKGLTERPMVIDYSDWGRPINGCGMGSYTAGFGDGDYTGNGRGANFNFGEDFNADAFFCRFKF